MRIDLCIQARRRERCQGALHCQTPARSRVGPTRLSTSPILQMEEPEPMQLGRTPLTPEEREHRRRLNLCLYCGKEGHFGNPRPLARTSSQPYLPVEDSPAEEPSSDSDSDHSGSTDNLVEELSVDPALRSMRLCLQPPLPAQPWWSFLVGHREPSLELEQSQAGLVTCVYWKENGTEASWSVEGCAVSFSNENYTVCSCTHLSTFALLLQIEKQDLIFEEEEEDPLLEMVNLFCMCVGLAFLAVAILTFLLCRWNPKINNTARLHLCICLFTGHLLFLLGVSRTENAVVCAVIAGALQYLFLSGFVWMLLETLQLFLLVRSLTKVQVIQKEGLRTLYLLLIGYGTPLVVVGVSAAVFSGGYGSEDSCWLRKEKDFHWSFIGPVAAVLSINLVSFCVILWSLQPTLASMKSDVSQSRDTRLIIFKIVAQFFVLGCAWILGFFQSSTMLKYLFIVLNSQQGTFIFIVHCLLNKEVREEYKKWFSCQSRTKAPSNSTDSKNSTPTVPK
ncbi:hypothetical protein GJAV_G00222430 [Gymnothorax javanicus]|nr:hypothetical protein GJAV_G00222430 [Gymnothorax javanicus]